MLDKEAKKVFVRNLVEEVQNNILELIDKGHLPDSWDGHELRLLLAEKFKHETTSLMSGKRLKDYNKVAVAKNL